MVTCCCRPEVLEVIGQLSDDVVNFARVTMMCHEIEDSADGPVHRVGVRQEFIRQFVEEGLPERILRGTLLGRQPSK